MAPSPWTHAICLMCWARRNGDRQPVVVVDSPSVRCCFCSDPTNAGIWVRSAPVDLLCLGAHSVKGGMLT
jgi:hypothetical protein